MTYTIEFNACIEKRLNKIDRHDLVRMIEKIDQLGSDPRPRWTEKLKGRPGYRIAIGNYRVVYSIDDVKKLVIVVEVDDRKDVYRKY